MTHFAALDISQETTAICIVGESGSVVAETKPPSCPDAIASFLADRAPDLVRVGLETGPLTVWLWNELMLRELPVICMDARHSHAAPRMGPVKTDCNDASGPAQIVRMGWFREVRIKSRDSSQIRARLVSRETLVRIRVKLENEICGLLTHPWRALRQAGRGLHQPSG